MINKDNFQDDNEKSNRIRKELQNLPKQKAAWHFESQLQQRIHAERRENFFAALFARPLPAYALTIFLLAGGGVLLYNLAFDNSPLQGTMESPADTAEGPAGTEAQQMVGPPVPLTDSRQSTAASQGSSTEVRVDLERPEARVREFTLPVTSVGGRPSSGRPAIIIHDSMAMRKVARDSVDSLEASGDSIRPKER